MRGGDKEMSNEQVVMAITALVGALAIGVLYYISREIDDGRN